MLQIGEGRKPQTASCALADGKSERASGGKGSNVGGRFLLSFSRLSSLSAPTLIGRLEFCVKLAGAKKC